MIAHSLGSYTIQRELGRGGIGAVYEEAGDQKSAVGRAAVLSVDPSDIRNPRVEIEAGKPLPKSVPLSAIKANKTFADSPLVHQGRLSVVPLTSAQFRVLTGE